MEVGQFFSQYCQRADGNSKLTNARQRLLVRLSGRLQLVGWASFASAASAIAIALFEDSRKYHGEQRMIAVGLLGALVVLIAHIETDDTIRTISTGRLIKMKRTSTIKTSARSNYAPTLPRATRKR